jgi:inhibitor of cysteine peptidase
MRKSLLVFACLLFVVGVSACSKKTTASLTSASPTPSATPATTTAAPTASTSSTPAASAAPAATKAPTPAPTKAKTRAPQTFVLTSKDNGKHLSLVKGDTVKLDLEANPSTGYSWVYDEKPNSSVLKELSSTQTPAPQTSPPVVGRPETHEWTYKAEGTGSTGVKLRYRPPGQTSGGNSFAFSVTVA